MATTTPNYGWPVPTSTDYVKDGATAIEALGDAIDATVFGLGSTGLTLINTTTFSAVASQAVNNVFSATYDDYRIMLDITTGTSDAIVYMKMRTGGIDNSLLYYYAFPGFTSANAANNSNSFNVITGWDLIEIDSATSDLYSFNGDIMKPFLAKPTKLIGQKASTTPTGTPYAQSGSAVHNVSTSFPSFNLIASAGNISGTVKVYGYRK